MTANKRIFLNVIATYGRSLYALVIGLIAGRWALMALGEIDFGLYGLIGGLIAFVSFLNSLMATAVGRYYAYAVGAASSDQSGGLTICREWFSTAVVIHTVLPIALILVGYPSGLWAIKSYLSIPPERVYACIWVWRFACISCFFSMFNVPFQAMFTAKQEIAELTIYGVMSTTLNFLFLCYMITHPGFWLIRYAAWMCFIMVLPQVIICVRAIAVFEECRFAKRNFWSFDRFYSLMKFAAGRFACALSLMIWHQGRAILINKFIGPMRNAAMSIGTSLAAQATTLMGAMSGALAPAVTAACGAGDVKRMRKLCFAMCKFGAFSTIIFAIPLVVEADNVLTIWLKNPPYGSAALCVCLLVEHCISRLVDGHVMGVFAVGKMGGFNATEALGYFMAFVLSYFLLRLTDLDILSVGLAVISCSFYTVIVKLYYGRENCGLSIRYWIFHIAIPSLVVVLCSLSAGFMVRYFLSATFLRVVVTTLVCECVIFALSWVLLCDADEKMYIVLKLRERLHK